MPESVDILGVRVDVVSKEDVEQAIVAIAAKGGHEYFGNVNIHAINLAWHDRAFREFLNKAPIVYCDGEGVRMGARILGTLLPPRIVLTYWIWDLCALCEREKLSVYLLGGTPEASRDAQERIAQRHPALRLSGHHGYFTKAGDDNDRVVQEVNAFRPDILFVCFGMPLQEHWTATNFSRLNARVVLFGGSTIEYTAGRKSVAPAWLSNRGGEWLYRLFQEPRRLWRRYVVGNPLFLYRILRQWMEGKHQ